MPWGLRVLTECIQRFPTYTHKSSGLQMIPRAVLPGPWIQPDCRCCMHKQQRRKLGLVSVLLVDLCKDEYNAAKTGWWILTDEL